MRTMSFLPGLRGSAGSLPWPPSSGFLWVLFTQCGCSLAHSCRWSVFTIPHFTGSVHVLMLLSEAVLILLVHFSSRNWSCPSHHTRWMRSQKRHIMRGEGRLEIQWSVSSAPASIYLKKLLLKHSSDTSASLHSVSQSEWLFATSS